MKNTFHKIFQSTQKRTGQSLILVILALPVLIGMAGAGVTVGTVYFAQTNLQNAVDAAALAGAQAMASGDTNAPGDEASLVTQNDNNAQNVSVIPDPNMANAVEAIATQSVPGGFTGIFGLNHFNVTAKAVASYGPGGAFGYAIFQGSTSNTLILNGGLNVQGSIHANQNISLGGGSTVSGNVNASGTIAPANGKSGNTYGSESQNVPVMPMPTWKLPPAASEPTTPSFSGTEVNGNFSQNSGTINENLIVQGNVFIGSSVTINGSIEAYGNITISGGDPVKGSLTSIGGTITVGGGDPISGSLSALDGNAASDSTIINVSGGDSIGGNVVATGGNISLAGGDPVSGSVWVSEGSINLSGRDSVNGSVTANNGNITLAGGDPVGGNITTNYGDINLQGGQQTEGYIATGNGNIDIGGGSGTSGSLTNPIAIMALGSGTNGNIEIQGGASVTGVIYSPKGTIKVKGGSDVTGAIVGENVDWEGSLVTYNPKAVSMAPSLGAILIQ